MRSQHLERGSLRGSPGYAFREIDTPDPSRAKQADQCVGSNSAWPNVRDGRRRIVIKRGRAVEQLKSPPHQPLILALPTDHTLSVLRRSFLSQVKERLQQRPVL